MRRTRTFCRRGGLPLTVYVDTDSSDAGIAVDMESPDGWYTVGGVSRYLTFYYSTDEVA